MSDGYHCPGIQTDTDILEGYREDASGLVGMPSGVVRARDTQDVQAALEWAWAHHAAVTPVGARTSTTGSASPTEGGIVLSTEALKGYEFVSDRIVRVRAGMNLGELKRSLAVEGWLYPPDPTSENDCTIGGTIATNASGPREFEIRADASVCEGHGSGSLQR